MVRSIVVVGAVWVAGLVACGGAVAPDPGGGGGAPTTTSTGTGAPTGSPTSTSAPPTPGSPPDSGAPPSATCARTDDRLLLSVDGLGHHDSCFGPEAAPSTYEVSGELTLAESSAVWIDVCAAGAPCPTDEILKIVASAPGLDLGVLPVHSFVKATVSFSHYFGCTSSIVLTSLAEWNGTKNPVDAGGLTYFVGADGGLGASGAPFTVERVGHGCMPGARTCSLNAADVYSLRFVGSLGTETLAMGDERWFGPEPGQFLTLRNLRSFNDGVCDADFDWAFFAVRNHGKGV